MFRCQEWIVKFFFIHKENPQIWIIRLSVQKWKQHIEQIISLVVLQNEKLQVWDSVDKFFYLSLNKFDLKLFCTNFFVFYLIWKYACNNEPHIQGHSQKVGNNLDNSFLRLTYFKNCFLKKNLYFYIFLATFLSCPLP